MTDAEIKAILKIPRPTLWSWKNIKSTKYKHTLYKILSKIDKDYIEYLLLEEKNKEPVKETFYSFINNLSILLYKFYNANIEDERLLVKNNVFFKKFFYAIQDITSNFDLFLGTYIIFKHMKTELIKDISGKGFDSYLKIEYIIRDTLELQEKIFKEFLNIKHIEKYAEMHYYAFKEKHNNMNILFYLLKRIRSYYSLPFEAENIIYSEIITSQKAKKIIKKYNLTEKLINLEEELEEYIKISKTISEILNKSKRNKGKYEPFDKKMRFIFKSIIFDCF